MSPFSGDACRAHTTRLPRQRNAEVPPSPYFNTGRRPPKSPARGGLSLRRRLARRGAWRMFGVVTIRDGFIGAVGATALIRINSLSEATGCEILGKAEHMEPGGSVKDRAARHI